MECTQWIINLGELRGDKINTSEAVNVVGKEYHSFVSIYRSRYRYE